LAIARPAGNWDPAVAALQLLCVGAAIGGKLKVEHSLEEMIDAAFDNWPPDCQSSAPEMVSIYSRLIKDKEKLAAQARAQISCMKGGRKGKMLDPHRFVRGVRDLRHSKWRLNLLPPLDDKGAPIASGKLYVAIASDLAEATQAEFTLRQTWLEQIETAFGAEVTKASIINVFSDLRDRAKEAGLAGGGNLRAFEDALELFGPSISTTPSMSAELSSSRKTLWRPSLTIPVPGVRLWSAREI
jgi:hypothetical protein